MFTNDYDARVWPESKTLMTLKGAARDRDNAQTFLEKVTPGIRVEGINERNPSRQYIKGRFKAAADGASSLVVAYFQGHSEGESGLRYITGDCNEDSALVGFTAENLIKMFSKLSTRTMSMVITDFCNSGNVYRLRFRLIVSAGGERFFWHETNEWKDDDKVDRKNRINSPMIHIAASLESQKAYETEKRGGYLTHSLATAESKTLPRVLIHLREGVGRDLKDARAHPDSPLPTNATQLPQIFSTCKLPLDDPEIFSKIYRGTAKPFYSNFA